MAETLPAAEAPTDAEIAVAADLRCGWKSGFGGGEHAARPGGRQHPDITLIACEVFENGICSLLSRPSTRGRSRRRRRLPANLRVWDADARPPDARVCPTPASKNFFCCFPDPWPKARHAKRRFVHPAMLIGSIARVLRPGGEWRIASDDPTYQAWVAKRIRETNRCSKPPPGLPWPDQAGWPANALRGSRRLRAGRQPAVLGAEASRPDVRVRPRIGWPPKPCARSCQYPPRQAAPACRTAACEHRILQTGLDTGAYKPRKSFRRLMSGGGLYGPPFFVLDHTDELTQTIHAMSASRPAWPKSWRPALAGPGLRTRPRRHPRARPPDGPDHGGPRRWRADQRSIRLRDDLSRYRRWMPSIVEDDPLPGAWTLEVSSGGHRPPADATQGLEPLRGTHGARRKMSMPIDGRKTFFRPHRSVPMTRSARRLRLDDGTEVARAPVRISAARNSCSPTP